MGTTDSHKIGWIGLGAMGIPMSENLIGAGYSLFVYNRTASKTERLVKAGAERVNVPGDLTRKSDIVFIMVADDDAVREVFSGENGLLTAGLSGKTYINMSTVSPDISIEMEQKCQEQGSHYLDAPVSGSVKQATEATLVIMCGGAESSFKAMKPLLEKLGKAVFHTGETGKGNAAKLAVNAFLAIITQGLAETTIFAKEMGIAPADFLDIINFGGLSSPYTRIKSQSILKDDYPPGFALKHMAKDLKLALNQQMNASMGKVAYNSFHEAQKELGEKDVMAIMQYISQNHLK